MEPSRMQSGPIPGPEGATWPGQLNDAVRRPVFLVGCVRSGTTMLRLMLSHHPAVAFHFESEFVVHSLKAGEPEPVGRLLRDHQDWLRADPTFQASGFVIDESLSYRELVRSFVRQKALWTGCPVVGMTVHEDFEQLPRIWPEARYIHILRDGRDVAHSAMKMGWYGNAWAATERWVRAIHCYDRLLEAVPTERILEVRFEDLVADPKGELERVCRFMGVDFDPAMLAIDQTSSYRAADSGEAANWRSHFDDRTCGLVEAEIGPLLERFGYALSGRPVVEISAEMRHRLVMEDRRLRRKWRLRRYGFPTLAAMRLGRWLRLSALEEAGRRRMLRVRRDHLK